MDCHTLARVLNSKMMKLCSYLLIGFNAIYWLFGRGYFLGHTDILYAIEYIVVVVISINLFGKQTA